MKNIQIKTCENINCIDGYIECDNCNGTNLDINDEVCQEEDCEGGLVECECNPNNILNK